jgi:type VI secretion system protein ImpB
MAESTQHKLDRVRTPRVHVTYDVQIGDAMEQKELPFVVGVIGDFTGKSSPDAPKLGARKFVEITPENFDSVLAAMKPRVQFSVPNRLNEDPDLDVSEAASADPAAPQLKVDLSFEKMEDFGPAHVAGKVEPLRKLLELRQKLSDLQGSLQGNDTLDALLQLAIQDTEKARQIEAELSRTEAPSNE